MGDACAEARAQLDRADTALAAASGYVAKLRAEESALASEAAAVETRFQDDSASAAKLDAEHRAAIELRGTRRAQLVTANEALSAARAEYEAAKAEQNPITGFRLIQATDALDAAKPVAEAADSAYQAAEAEMAAAEARAAKATAYLQTVANEREAVRVRRQTNESQLGIALGEERAADAEQKAAASAAAAACN